MELKIRETREKQGVTQAELAETIGVDIKTVGNWERGKTVPKVEQLWDCAMALHSSPNELLAWAAPDAPSISPFEGALVGHYRAADQMGKQTIMNVAASLAQTRQVEDFDAREVKGA